MVDGEGRGAVVRAVDGDGQMKGVGGLVMVVVWELLVVGLS